MIRLIPITISFLILGLFLYSKLLPYKDRLNPRYKKIFSFFDSIFSPIFNHLKKLIKPFNVGIGISVDMTQIALLTFFLILLNTF